MITRTLSASLLLLSMNSCGGRAPARAASALPIEVRLPPEPVLEPIPSGVPAAVANLAPTSPLPPSPAAEPVTDSLIEVSASCVDNTECRYRGETLYFEIRITSRDTTDLVFPFAFLKRAGPDIRLFDPRTKEEHFPAPPPVDPGPYPDMLLHPGQTIVMEWGIDASVEAFRSSRIDLIAEITIDIPVKRKGVETRVKATTRVHIGGFIKKRRFPGRR